MLGHNFEDLWTVFTSQVNKDVVFIRPNVPGDVNMGMIYDLKTHRARWVEDLPVHELGPTISLHSLSQTVVNDVVDEIAIVGFNAKSARTPTKLLDIQ